MRRFISYRLLLVLALALFPVPLVHGETLTELQTKLDLLKRELETLQNRTSVSLARDLALGVSSEDVKKLQQILNLDPRTQVNLAGKPGGPGLETAYFGPQTEKSVKIFQNIYKKDVLLPARLSNPTGFVGPLTRVKLNALALRQSLPGEIKAPATPTSSTPPVSAPTPVAAPSTNIAQTAPSTPTTSTASTPAAPLLSEISPTRGAPGTQITLRGKGFGASNTVQTSWEAIENVPSSDGATLSIVAGSPLSGGDLSRMGELPLYIYVENANGASEALLFTITP